MAYEWLMFMVNVGKYIPYVDSLENEFYRSERFCVFFPSSSCSSSRSLIQASD